MRRRLRCQVGAPTARLIERALVDNVLKARAGGFPVDDDELALARAIQETLTISTWRASFSLKDISSLLECFERGIVKLTQSRATHPSCVRALVRLWHELEEFRGTPAIESLAQLVG